MLAGSVSEGILFGLSQGYATVGYSNTNQDATILGGMRALADAGAVAQPSPFLKPFSAGSGSEIVALTGKDSADDAEDYVRGKVFGYGLENQAWHYRAMSLIDAAQWVGAQHETVGDYLAATGNIWLQLAGIAASGKEESFEQIMELSRNDHERSLEALDSIGASAAQILDVRAATLLDRKELETYLTYAEYALAGVVGATTLFAAGWSIGKFARRAKDRYGGRQVS
jgi:hypothetical protein